MARSKKRPKERDPASSKKRGTRAEEDTVVDTDNLTTDSIYEFYTQQLYPALVSSLPLLAERLVRDSRDGLIAAWHSFVQFLLPTWMRNTPELPVLSLPNLHNVPNPGEFMLKVFDTNHDGHISAAELLHISDMLQAASSRSHITSWSAWFSREWPLMDWKVGVFLWRTFGGILLLLSLCSIIPGRMHGWSARILRWPVLALTYFLVAVELAVYAAIRLLIKLAEFLIARPRHRALRRRMRQARTYDEWYRCAQTLDASQKRDEWLLKHTDRSDPRYNWGYVRELVHDLRKARAGGDSLMALAVLQQCTRKNVGGVMSEDLFSYSNTGEPKHIVSEFVEEVAITIRWVTEEAMKVTQGEEGDDAYAKETYEERLQRKVRKEKQKLLSTLVDATLGFLGGFGNDSNHDKSNHNMSATELSVGSSTGDATGAAALPAFHRHEVLAFLKRARAAYGRTALCLSGGAMMGLYHFGHILGLLENGMLPHIISGTSAGSVVASIICTRTDDEIRRDLNPMILADKIKCFERPWSERFKSIWRNGHMFDFDDWMELMQWYVLVDGRLG